LWNYNPTDFPLNQVENSDNIVGVALNGVFLMNGVNSDGFDGFYPKAYNSRRVSYFELDICYGSSELRNTYAYRMFSPCMFPATTIRKYTSKCENEDYVYCKTNPLKHI